VIMAHEDHMCDNCHYPIFPGDEYKGEVWVMKGRIVVFKYHVECPVDPWEEEERILREMEEFFSSLKRAA